MRRRVVTAWVVPVVLLAGTGGYAWADARDMVPGILTDNPVSATPAPFLAAQSIDPAPGADSLAGALGEAPLPDAAALQPLAQALREDPRTGTSTSVAVADLVTGEMLVDVAANDPQTPASTAKILTTLAAVHVLGPEYTFATTAVFDPSRAEVAILAGGDMMLAPDAGHYGSLDQANGWAGVGDLADQVAAALAAAGVSAVTVVYDDSGYPGPAVPAAWPTYVVPMGYGAPVTGLGIDIARTTSDFYAPRWPNPSAHVGEVLAQRLVERGIAATYTGSRAGATGNQVGVVFSAPLWRVAEHTIIDSDNTIAELMSRVLAKETGRPATPAGASAAVLAGLQDLGFDTTGIEFYDGAGYSTRNRVSAAQLVAALRLTLSDSNTGEFLRWLPIGALEGTVGGRYNDTPAAGVVRAKTGSLTGVTSLAGIVQTAEGRVLVFAVLADGMPAGQDRPRSAIDEFVTALAQCGCTS